MYIQNRNENENVRRINSNNDELINLLNNKSRKYSLFLLFSNILVILFIYFYKTGFNFSDIDNKMILRNLHRKNENHNGTEVKHLVQLSEHTFKGSWKTNTSLFDFFDNSEGVIRIFIHLTKNLRMNKAFVVNYSIFIHDGKLKTKWFFLYMSKPLYLNETVTNIQLLNKTDNETFFSQENLQFDIYGFEGFEYKKKS